MERTIFPKKKYKDCIVCHHKLRATIEGEILQGTPLIVLSDGYDLSVRQLSHHLKHMRDQLATEVRRDAAEVLARVIEQMEKRWAEAD